VQFKQGANPFAEPEKRKAGEGIVSMRKRKNEQRAKLKERKDEERNKR
jgi:GTP-binding protein